MRAALILAVLAGLPMTVRAQTHPPSAGLPSFEIEAGGGYVFGGGAEDPGPSLASFDVGTVFWPVAHWGVAFGLVRGPGEDHHDPVEGYDRTFFGPENLAYWTITARYRRETRYSLVGEIGFGLMGGGRFSDLEYLHAQQRWIHVKTVFGGFVLETFWSRPITRHLGVKGGVTFDFNVETNNLQPVLLATVRF